MTPIEKNIIVTDADGKTIGSTYPKRAKMLVKNGRAEYAGDHIIRLRFTRAPTAVDDTTEELKMSKVINFNAREYKLDESCSSNVGERAFMSTSLGSAEMWEIGSWQWDWTQIVSEKKLEKNTDYVLRFAMLGGHCDTFDATSKVILYTTDGYETGEAAWEDRMTFEIAQSRYEPIISKRDKTGLLRVFEIPFNTGEKENWRIVFVAMHAVAKFFAARENSAYDKLEDFTYDEWRREREQQLRGENSNGNFNFDLSDLMEGNIDGGKILSFIHDLIRPRTNNSPDSKSADGTTMAVESQEFSESEFAERLQRIGDGCNVVFENVTVRSGTNGGNTDTGAATNGSNIAFSGCTLTSLAMSMIIAKLGDGCTVAFDKVTVTEEGLGNMLNVGKTADGMNIALENVTIPKKVLDLIYAKMGDGCNMGTQNIKTFDARTAKSEIETEKTAVDDET